MVKSSKQEKVAELSQQSGRAPILKGSPDETDELLTEIEAFLDKVYRETTLKGEPEVVEWTKLAEPRIESLFQDLLRSLGEVIYRNTPIERRQIFLIEAEVAFIDAYVRIIAELGKLAASEPTTWSQVRNRAHNLMRKCEVAKRRLRLRYPPSVEEFEFAIRWMAEQGDIEELDLLRQVRAHPPYDSDEIRRLLDLAEDQIHDRVYDPQRVVDREEAAYQQHQQEWDEQYKGKFIAIHRGQVIDHDANKRRLIQRLDQKQREEGRFRAYIVQIGAPLYVARGPAMGRRVTQTKE